MMGLKAGCSIFLLLPRLSPAGEEEGDGRGRWDRGRPRPCSGSEWHDPWADHSHPALSSGHSGHLETQVQACSLHRIIIK